MPDKKCFIIMPITTPEKHISSYNDDLEHFRHVMKLIFEPAIRNAGFEPIPPVTQGSEVIHGEIISNIISSDLVLCDMSLFNPNVFFELGIRTALNKPVCLVRDNSENNMPFDTHIINCHVYLPDLQGWTISDEIEKLETHIKECFSRSNNCNSLWKYFSLMPISTNTEKLNREPEKLDYLIMQIDAIRKQLSEKSKVSLNSQVSSNSQEENRHLYETAMRNKEIADKTFDIEKMKIEVQKDKLKELRKIENYSDEVSNKIANNLMNNPTWLEKFTDEVGITYGGSVFGTRINHFHYEKRALAKKAIDVLENELLTHKGMKYCLLIDSGTTMYHLFREICERIRGKNNSTGKNSTEARIWAKRVFIITNNLPGIQYLMKYCKTESGEYADLILPCLLLPGEPLPVYAAVTGSETNGFLEGEHIRRIIRDKLEVSEDDYEIVGFITSNYMVRHPSGKTDKGDTYCPVARGGGHFELKTEFAKLSDKIYLISPLTKFSFATCEQLNEINGFNISEITQLEESKQTPNKVMYREIKLYEDEFKKKCTFFITGRENRDIFKDFADQLKYELIGSYGSEKVIIATDFKLVESIPVDRNDDDYTDIELKREIPHASLRDAYLEMKKEGHFIWDKSWIVNPRNRL